MAKGTRKRTLTAVLVALGGLLALGAGIALGAQWWVNSRVEVLEDPFEELTDRPTPPAVEKDEKRPVNVLVLGSDSRISAGNPEEWQAGAQRTDAIMLVQLAGDRRNLTVMSIPRDSWVDVPGHGMNKINAAFSFGGPSLMIETVEQLTGVYIDHFAVTDFESFSELTDELGGVEISLTRNLNVAGETLGPGTHRLNGEQALAYVRQRYGLAGGDFSRVKRQQNWMRAIMLETIDSGALKDPVKLMKLADIVASSASVDPELTTTRMVELAFSARSLRPDDITFFTLPHSGIGWSPDGKQSIVVVEEHKIEPVFEAFRAGTIFEYVKAHASELIKLTGDPD